MKKRKVGDLVSGAGSSSSDECTEAQVSSCERISASTSVRLAFDSASKAIELARTLKPDDAMRVRANDVKVAAAALFTHPFFLCTFLVNCSSYSSIYSPHNQLQGAEFWGALESVFRPFEGRDLEFLRTSATLDEDSAMRVLPEHCTLCYECPVAHLASSQVPPIQRFSLSTKKDAKGKTKVLKLVSAPKEPTTVFDMCPVWFRLCCALVDNPKEDAAQTLRDMNRVTNVNNVGVNLSCNDLNIGALASLQVSTVLKAWIPSKSLTTFCCRVSTRFQRAGHTGWCFC